MASEGLMAPESTVWNYDPISRGLKHRGLDGYVLPQDTNVWNYSNPE